MKPCPNCKEQGMPNIEPESKCTARRCYLCGHVEELVPQVILPKGSK